MYCARAFRDMSLLTSVSARLLFSSLVQALSALAQVTACRLYCAPKYQGEIGKNADS